MFYFSVMINIKKCDWECAHMFEVTTTNRSPMKGIQVFCRVASYTSGRLGVAWTCYLTTPTVTISWLQVRAKYEGSRPLQVHIRGHDYFAHGSTFTKPYKGSEQHNGVTGLQTSHKSDLNPMYRLQGEVPLSLGILTLIEYSVTLVKICHLAKWHLHLSRHLAKVHQRYKQTTDRIRTTITRPTQLAKNGNLKTNITSIVPLPNDISVHSHVS